MRLYEFELGEMLGNSEVRRCLINLDLVRTIREWERDKKVYWTVGLAGGDALLLTQAAFERIKHAMESR